MLSAQENMSTARTTEDMTLLMPVNKPVTSQEMDKTKVTFSPPHQQTLNLTRLTKAPRKSLKMAREFLSNAKERVELSTAIKKVMRRDQWHWEAQILH